MATAMEKLEKLLEQVFVMGFDRSYISDDGLHVRVRCSQCEALCINGYATHETGCPNQPKECPACEELIPKGQSCDCMGTLEDDLDEPRPTTFGELEL